MSYIFSIYVFNKTKHILHNTDFKYNNTSKLFFDLEFRTQTVHDHNINNEN